MQDKSEAAASPHGEGLRRDNVRFTFWRDNGEPKLADDCDAEVEFVHSIQAIRQEKERASQ
ncbi:MAG: hypothetical protein AAGI28_03585 [Pseudomonadota bacterium]